MTLYNELQEEEKGIALLQKEIHHLQDNGFSIEGKLPILEDESRRLLREKYHHLVGYIPRITSCSLEGHVDELLTQRSWRLKYHKEERGRFNERIEELAEAVPSASRLKRGSFLSVQEFEGVISFCGASSVFIVFLADCASYLCFGEVLTDKTPWMYLYGGFGVLGGVLGAYFSLLDGGSSFKRFAQRARNEAGYIDKTLGYEKGTH